MLPTSAGIEPATSWSPVGRRIQLSHRGRLLALYSAGINFTFKTIIYYISYNGKTEDVFIYLNLDMKVS